MAGQTGKLVTLTSVVHYVCICVIALPAFSLSLNETETKPTHVCTKEEFRVKWQTTECVDDEDGGERCRTTSGHTIKPKTSCQEVDFCNGTVPFPSKNCSPGWMQMQNHCYKFDTRVYTWDNAKIVCDRMGGHLVSIGSYLERKAVLHTLQSDNVKTNVPFWVGLRRQSPNAKLLVWEDGTGLNKSASPWTSENLDLDPLGNCVEITEKGKLQTSLCSSHKAFICERCLLGTFGDDCCPECPGDCTVCDRYSGYCSGGGSLPKNFAGRFGHAVLLIFVVYFTGPL